MTFAAPSSTSVTHRAAARRERRGDVEFAMTIASLCRPTHRNAIALLVVAAVGVPLAAESPQQTFAKTWAGRTVTVKATLYSLIFNERGKLGTTRSGLREGLVVATPSKGAYFQFDGRQGRAEIARNSLDGFIAAVNAEYEQNALDVRPYRKLEAVAINRYDPGVELLITGVQVGPDQVRFELSAGGGETATAIRIKWPVPLSKSFNERPLVENVLQQFVDIQP
jgi:hypothetical protein